MIQTRTELNFYLKADRMINRGTFKRSWKTWLYELFSPDNVMDYLKHLRKREYYISKNSILDKAKANFHGLRQRQLGAKLGFSISINTLGYGVVIPHYGTIVVGGGNSIGNFAVLHTSTCITNGHKKIGDGLYVSTGAKLTTTEYLGDNVTVAANSVVTKSFNDSNILLVGMPANIKREQRPWYEENENYKKRIEQIRILKEKLNV